MAEKVDRLTRVNELLKREIANAIERGLITAPGMLVSVTEVNTSVDPAQCNGLRQHFRAATTPPAAR